MLSQELQQLLEVVPKNFADPSADYLAVRAMFGPFHGHPVPDDLQITINELGGVRVGHYSNPQTAGVQRTVFHCHGGAFVSCPLDVYHFYAEMIMRLTHSKVVVPDYRLAPEHPYPAASDDCFNAYRGLLESGVDPQTIYFFGESCGGSLAVGTLLRARDAGLPMPRGFVSLTGWFDLTVADTSLITDIKGNSRDPFLTPAWVRNRTTEYLAGAIAPKNPLVSPAYADLTGLPPMYLQIGQYDTVREGALKLAANAVRDGVAVTMESWPEMIHGWQGLANMQVPEALAAWKKIREYLDKN
ncbi:MAG TPA: alpha/beta hydrolase [Spongiibacteraceae bacterium]|nr:alpha/beta hydrolase [Spongiibacteraceae bacterium]